MPSRLPLALLALFALALGCAKQSASTSYAYGSGTGGGDEYKSAPDGYAYEDLDVAVVAESAPTRARAAKKEKADFRRDRFKVEEEAPAPAMAPEPEPSEVAPEGKPSEASEPANDDPDPVDRQIIYTAALLLAVYELDAAIAFAEDIPRRHGGWIQARYDYSITLRVPAEHLQVVITELSELGEVLGKTLQADDVTDQYTDLDARIRVLEQLVEQLELLLVAAKTVEDSLKVRQELERVRIELESAKAQMRQLAESIAFSTLTVSLSKRGPVEALPSSNDPFPWVDELGVESTEFR